MQEMAAPLPEWTMYAILGAQGLIYTVAVWFLGKSKGKTATSMLSGGRDIGHGMINASIIATWIWAATLMISSWTGYRWGVTGPWWYALGATIPLPIMAFLSRKVKTVMPKVTSYPEFVLFRSDRKNHIIHSIITIIVCFWVTIMIITGGGVLLVIFTGAPFWVIALIMVAIFVTYISLAGLWASIFADTVMCCIMYGCLMVIAWTVVIKVGPGTIWEGLHDVMVNKPVLTPDIKEEAWKYQWQPLNWLNLRALGFLIVNTIGNLGAVLCNQTYWSRAVGAKDPDTAYRSFWTAAFCWFVIPFSTATALGVTGLSMGMKVGEVYTSPVAGIEILFTESSAVAPLMSFMILGFVGLALFIIAVGGATISTGAGEVMAIVTVIVNDVYYGHINPNASGHKMLVQSRLWMFITAGALLGVTLWWHYAEFTFGMMYEAMGIAFSSAVIPIILFILWSKTNKEGAFWGTLIGAFCGIFYWVVITGLDPLWGVVWGNIIVMGVSALILIPWTLIHPQPFDYSTLHDKYFKYQDVDELITAGGTGKEG